MTLMELVAALEVACDNGLEKEAVVAALTTDGMPFVITGFSWENSYAEDGTQTIWLTLEDVDE